MRYDMNATEASADWASQHHKRWKLTRQASLFLSLIITPSGETKRQMSRSLWGTPTRLVMLT